MQERQRNTCELVAFVRTLTEILHNRLRSLIVANLHLACPGNKSVAEKMLNLHCSVFVFRGNRGSKESKESDPKP